MIEVTVRFRDQEQFNQFLETNKVEQYTWNKGKIAIDLSGAVQSAMTEASSRTTEIEQKVETPMPSSEVMTPSESMF